MNRTVAKGILSVVTSLVTSAILAAPAAAWGWRHRSCLEPNGTDDTIEVQSALDECSEARRSCVVSLCEGVFRIAQVRVKDFRGVLRGAGREKTFIEALPNLEVNDNPDGYFRDDPFDPGLAPWPILMQFVEGKATLRDFTVEIPTPAPGDRPTRGWGPFLDEDGDVQKIFELDVAILITGKDPVDYAVKRVGVVAGDDPASDIRTTLLNGITFEGRLFDELGDPAGFPVFPVRGRYRLQYGEFVGMLSGSGVAELKGARVTVANNHYQTAIAMFVQDAYRSHIKILNNQWDVDNFGLQVFLNVDGVLSEKNSFSIFGNRGTTDVPFLDFGFGVFFVDPWDPAREPGGSVVSLAHNTISVTARDRPAMSGIQVYGAGRLWVWKNAVQGRAVTGGISVDRTRGCWLAGNALETTDGPDLVLGPDTSRCLAVVGRDDVVVDDGTGNWIFRR